MAKTPRLRHFETETAAKHYIVDELLATLRDDLHRMTYEERTHYTRDDRQEMRYRIHDIEQVAPRLTLGSPATEPLIDALFPLIGIAKWALDNGGNHDVIKPVIALARQAIANARKEHT